MIYVAWIIGIYLSCLVGLYLYSVAMTYNLIGHFDLRIYEDRVGVCKYPKFTLGWMYKLWKKVSN